MFWRIGNIFGSALREGFVELIDKILFACSITTHNEIHECFRRQAALIAEDPRVTKLLYAMHV